MRRNLISISLSAAALAALAGAAFAAALPIVIEPPGTVEARFRVDYTSAALPASRPAPVSLAFSEWIASRQGDHPPALQELQVNLNRHLRMSVKGLPRCGGRLQPRLPQTEMLPQCEDAKVGSGTIEVEVAFPEQQPVRATGRISVYNGGSNDGRTMFWLYALIPAPIAGTINLPLEVRRVSQGIYGWNGVLKVPKIANGSASVAYLRIGFRKGIFSAACPTGKLQSGAAASFVDGTTLQSASIHACRTTAGPR